MLKSLKPSHRVCLTTFFLGETVQVCVCPGKHPHRLICSGPACTALPCLFPSFACQTSNCVLLHCTEADGRGQGQQHRELPDSYNQRMGSQQGQQQQQMPLKKQAQHVQRQEPAFAAQRQQSDHQVCVQDTLWEHKLGVGVCGFRTDWSEESQESHRQTTGKAHESCQNITMLDHL